MRGLYRSVCIICISVHTAALRLTVRPEDRRKVQDEPVLVSLSRLLKILFHSCNAMMEFPIWLRKKRQICCEGLECGFWLLSLLLIKVCSQHAVTFPSHRTYFIRHQVMVIVKTDNVNSLSDFVSCKVKYRNLSANKSCWLVHVSPGTLRFCYKIT